MIQDKHTVTVGNAIRTAVNFMTTPGWFQDILNAPPDGDELAPNIALVTLVTAWIIFKKDHPELAEEF